jgi:tight adherence protein B
VIALALALCAAFGVHLLWTRIALGWSGLGVGPTDHERRPTEPAINRWLRQAGLDDTSPVEFVSVTVTLAMLGGSVAFALFGSPLPVLLASGFAGTAPVATYRSRRRRRAQRAQEAWPHLIEEIRILTGSVGRSIPQALFEAGRRAPTDLHRAFEDAHREWLITTDFARTTSVLKDRLADPTADAACETLLVAHEVGGADLDQRLEALVEDRIMDLHGRRDARSKQAGARFARWFVLVVPVGMALAGMGVGDGRDAYQEPSGQLLVAVGMGVIVGCWVWASRIMRLPDEDRVFDR